MNNLKIFIKSFLAQQKDFNELLKMGYLSFKKYLLSTFLNISGYYYKNLKNDLNYLNYLNNKYKF